MTLSRRSGLRRTTPLQAHTRLERAMLLPAPVAPLQRTGRLERGDGTPQRGKASGRSGKAQPAQPVPTSVRTAVYERDGYRCQRCGRDTPVGLRQLQHRVARGAGGRREHWAMSALVLVCGRSSTDPDGCHHRIEASPDEARRDGFRVPAGVDPTTHPVRRYDGQRVLLGDDGTATITTLEEAS